MGELDLTDPMVRAMAERNHQPEEMWRIDGALFSVHCETCKQTWPCPTRQALDSLCTCPDVDVTQPHERPGSRTVGGFDPRCPQHGGGR